MVEWLTKDFKEWSKMQDPNRPREMPKKTSQRKEDTNGCTTLLMNNLQKEAASKQDDRTNWECGDLIRNSFPVGYVYFEYTHE